MHPADVAFLLLIVVPVLLAIVFLIVEFSRSQ